jgi:hypothetical protein
MAIATFTVFDFFCAVCAEVNLAFVAVEERLPSAFAVDLAI